VVEISVPEALGEEVANSVRDRLAEVEAAD
jgi:hypothetical protein